MHCRSFLLLDRELQHLEVEPLWGITVYRVPSAPLLCIAVLSGLKDSVWEDGKFHVTLKFSEHYNEEPPDITFNTIPFHPNIDAATGKLCVEFMKQSQSGKVLSITLTSILLNVQSLLSNPVLTSPVNSEAAALLQNSPNDYADIAKHCVTESAQVQEALHEKFLENFAAALADPAKEKVEVVRDVPKELTPINSMPLKAKQVSFDVYHKIWTQVATTKPISRYVECDEDEITLRMWNQDFSAVRTVTPADARRIKQHASSPLAPANSREVKETRSKQKKLDRVSAMKKLYMNQPSGGGGGSETMATPSTSFADFPRGNVNIGPSASEAWDQEAQELVAWTDALNEDAV